MHVARNEMHDDACGFGRHDSWDRSIDKGGMYFSQDPTMRITSKFTLIGS